MQVLSFLKYGAVGLCGILMYLAYRLLSKEQGSPRPRKENLRAIQIFMTFAVVTMAIGAASELASPRLLRPVEQTSRLASGLPESYFTGKWSLEDSHDVDFERFKARYTYTGTLSSQVEGGDWVLEGNLATIDSTTHLNRGTALFAARGPISNAQVAMSYTLTRQGVSGFGTAFVEFDSAGNADMFLVFRITRTLPNEGDIGAAKLHIAHLGVSH